MFIIRSVEIKDLDDLYALSQTVLFINLPADKEIIKKRIDSSIKSFTRPSTDLAENFYVFVLEDFESGKVIGVSMVHAQHGTEEEPHFFLKVGQEHKYSTSINTGFILGTLKLGWDMNGPSEIGGIVLSHSYRGHQEKLGKQLSYVRFLYMGTNPHRFKDVILSELMPPLDKDGKSPLWEAVGRKFLNMDYHEADVLSRSNKEFILSLFPSENIYVNLLPMEARNAIGKVGPETQGVKKMLKSVGFKYTHEVDPFDGGPHYRCKLKDIKPIKGMRMGELKIKNAHFDAAVAEDVLLQLPTDTHSFSAIKTLINFKDGLISIPSDVSAKLKLKDGSKVSFIGLDF